MPFRPDNCAARCPLTRHNSNKGNQRAKKNFTKKTCVLFKPQTLKITFRHQRQAQDYKGDLERFSPLLRGNGEAWARLLG